MESWFSAETFWVWLLLYISSSILVFRVSTRITHHTLFRHCKVFLTHMSKSFQTFPNQWQRLLWPSEDISMTPLVQNQSSVLFRLSLIHNVPHPELRRGEVYLAQYQGIQELHSRRELHSKDVFHNSWWLRSRAREQNQRERGQGSHLVPRS